MQPELFIIWYTSVEFGTSLKKSIVSASKGTTISCTTWRICPIPPRLKLRKIQERTSPGRLSSMLWVGSPVIAGRVQREWGTIGRCRPSKLQERLMRFGIRILFHFRSNKPIHRSILSERKSKVSHQLTITDNAVPIRCGWMRRPGCPSAVARPIQVADVCTCSTNIGNLNHWWPTPSRISTVVSPTWLRAPIHNLSDKVSSLALVVSKWENFTHASPSSHYQLLPESLLPFHFLSHENSYSLVLKMWSTFCCKFWLRNLPQRLTYSKSPIFS